VIRVDQYVVSGSADQCVRRRFFCWLVSFARYNSVVVVLYHLSQVLTHRWASYFITGLQRVKLETNMWRLTTHRTRGRTQSLEITVNYKEQRGVKYLRRIALPYGRCLNSKNNSSMCMRYCQ